MIATAAATGAKSKATGGPRRAMPAEVRAPLAFVRAILEGGKVGPARLWMLLQVDDAAGRGFVTLDRARALASGDDLDQGAGLFWTVDQGRGRVLLRSPGKIARALGVGSWSPRRRVALPVAELAAGPDRAAAAMRAAVEAQLTAAERRGWSPAEVDG